MVVHTVICFVIVVHVTFECILLVYYIRDFVPILLQIGPSKATVYLHIVI